MDQNERIVKLLEEIRDSQKEHLGIYKKFTEKYSRLLKILLPAILILFLFGTLSIVVVSLT